jgi:ArsR family transcriptional regulator, arsenate/arsenite/antimonite-responsive transcriptional repressor
MAHIKSDQYENEEMLIARYSKALSHPARVAILKLLASQDTCFCGDIVKELPIAQATVSQHLKELKESGLINGDIEPPKVKYCIDRKHWKQAKKLLCEFFCCCQVK